MGTFEARHRRFVIVSDLIYLHLGSGGSGEVGPIPLEAAVDLKLLSSTNMAGYRVIDKGATFVDVLGGARFTREKLDIGLSAPNGSFGRDFSKTSVGPVLASRFRTAFGRRWGTALYGDIGALRHLVRPFMAADGYRSIRAQQALAAGRRMAALLGARQAPRIRRSAFV